MFAFAHWCVLLHSGFHTSDALLSYNDASSNEKPCLFICCWLVYIPFQCYHRLHGPLKFTSVGWLAYASPFQSFQPRQTGTGPGRRGWILQSSVSWPLWGPLKVKQSARKEKQTTPCKSNLSSLLETQRGFRVADGPLCHPSVGRRTGAAWSLHNLALRLFQAALSPQWLFTDLNSSFQWLCNTFLCIIQSTVQKIYLNLKVLM